MRIFRFRHLLAASAAFVLLGPFSLLHAQRIWDPGLRSGLLRTDYAAGIGTATQPLELRYDQAGSEGCKFDASNAFTACPARRGAEAMWHGGLQTRLACGGDTTPYADSWRGCAIWPSDLYFGSPGVSTYYWVIHANDDPDFDQCNEGPPGLSHPVRTLTNPNASLFRMGLQRPFGADPYLTFTLDVGAKNWNCASAGGLRASIPFLSVGAQDGRGNGGPAGVLRGEQSPLGTIAFDLAVPSYTAFGCSAGTSAICWPAVVGVHAGVYARAEWGGAQHLLFLDLFGAGVEDFSANPPGGNSRWNWPIADSMFFPGAEIAEFVAGAALQQQCGVAVPRLPTDGTRQNYRIDFGRLYRCASDLNLYAQPMPAGDVALNGVHWFVEGPGTAGSMSLNLSRAETALFVADFD